jgi:hypothetical protein
LVEHEQKALFKLDVGCVNMRYQSGQGMRFRLDGERDLKEERCKWIKSQTGAGLRMQELSLSIGSIRAPSGQLRSEWTASPLPRFEWE